MAGPFTVHSLILTAVRCASHLGYIGHWTKKTSLQHSRSYELVETGLHVKSQINNKYKIESKRCQQASHDELPSERDRLDLLSVWC